MAIDHMRGGRTSVTVATNVSALFLGSTRRVHQILEIIVVY
ncbi:hypothetical protein M6B38_311980 [Iris pallida]|uniref:Uncharacterized protein n=1 Tax=Iris pallida TaxID=29817 RepID=A0AAX6HGM9_IRIPA|nr:hypothetical protein M6B38_123655 [Iris pallida]KAJ6839882.1 hypothetical protein M6B38_311980 [Iris pallida]